MIFCMPVPEKEKKRSHFNFVRYTGLCTHILGTRGLFLTACGGMLWCWRVTTKTWPKLETVHETSLAPRVLPTLQNRHYNKKKSWKFF